MNTILQNILLPTDELCSIEEVYYHSDPDGTITDFDGYFNLFYIEKHKRYTAISGVSLNLMLKGYDSITVMHDRTELVTYELGPNSDICSKEQSAKDQTADDHVTYPGSYRIDLPYDEYTDGVFWFRLRQSSPGSVTHIEGYYEGEVSSLRPARVFVDICTYKREKYVLRNLKRTVDFLNRDNHRYISDNVIIALIDNGHTLKDCKDITDIVDLYDNISIIENKNNGGAGGFTRGMREAIALKEGKELTHVLLMDDDASYDMELFIRLFGILMTLRDEYSDITVGGALWREDFPFIQHASGEWFEKLATYNSIPFLDMRSYEECTCEDMCTTSEEHKLYSGWWCCCYSLDIVRNDNLPLQIFIHGDDIEYEKRARSCGNAVVFINGIGAWHNAFDIEYPGVKQYYDARNFLILTALHEPELTKKFIARKIGRILFARVFWRRYPELQLAYTGSMDFLKGRDWLDSLDPEEHHKEVSALCKKLTDYVPVDEIDVPNKSEILDKINGITPDSVLNKLLSSRNERPGAVQCLIMCIRNGLLSLKRRDASLTTPDERFYTMDLRHKKTVLYSPSSNKAMVVKSDPLKFFTAWKMYRAFAKGLKDCDLTQWRM